MTLERREISRNIKVVEVINGALAGIAVVAIVQMLSLQSLDVGLTVSVCCFAVSIPFLASLLLCKIQSERFGFTTNNVAIGRVSDFGKIFSLVGIGALFFHFTVYAGIIFI